MSQNIEFENKKMNIAKQLLLSKLHLAKGVCTNNTLITLLKFKGRNFFKTLSLHNQDDKFISQSNYLLEVLLYLSNNFYQFL